MFHVVSWVVWMRKIRRPAELIRAEVFDHFCPRRFVRISTHKALLSESLLRSSGYLDTALADLGIEDRFHLEGSQGAAIEYFGGAVKGMVGSAFIYTNRDSISVGVGCLIEDYLRSKTAPYELLDEFKAHSSVAPLLRGGEKVEYATKMIPEDSYDDFSDLYAAGVMLVGDCAGLVNPSIHHEGTNLAMASGVLAAEAFLEAREKQDFSRSGLESYRNRLDASWVMQDLEHYRGTVDFLRANREFVDSYPRITVELMRDYFTVDDTPKAEVRRRLMRKVRDEVSFFRLVRQLWQARKTLV